MKPGNKIIDKIVGEVIRDGQPGRIIVEGRDLLDVLSERPKNNSPQKEPDQKKDTGFFKRVWEKIQKKCTWLKWVKVRLEAPGNRGLHFSLALAIAFMMLVVSVWYGIFFIKDVILYETEFTTNEQGAIVPKKPLGGEYVLYLFNTSDIWANPGIQVNKNDRIRISISGGFNSSVEEALDAAIENTKVKYDWVLPIKMGQKPEKEPEWSLEYCLSRGKECTSGKWPHRTTQYFDYGTVMYTIQPESADIQDHPLYVKHEIQAWRPKQGFQRARKSGYLFFSVNDLILEPTDSAKAYYEKKYTSDSLYVMNPLLQDSIRFAKDIGKSDSLRLVEYKLRAIRNDIKNDLREKEIVLKDPHFLYKDNLGQLLVAVEIKRTITPFFWRWPEVFFRGFESSICWMKESLHSLKTRCYLAPKDNNGPYNTVRWLSNTLTGVTYYAAFIIGAIFLFFSFGLANMVMLFVWTILLCAVICFVLQLRHWMVQFYRRARRKQCNNQKESS